MPQRMTKIAVYLCEKCLADLKQNKEYETETETPLYRPVFEEMRCAACHHLFNSFNDLNREAKEMGKKIVKFGLRSSPILREAFDNEVENLKLIQEEMRRRDMERGK